MAPPTRTLTAALMLMLLQGAVGADQPPVFLGSALQPWVQSALNARADIVCIGDSNQAFGGHGWDHGLNKAAAQRFGLFATGVQSVGENTGQGLGLGYEWSILGTACCVPSFLHTGAPTELDALMDADVFMYPMNYIYLPSGGAAGGAANLGLQVQASCPIDVNARLRYEVTYGLFTGAPGSFRLSIRIGQPPYSELVSGAPVPTAEALPPPPLPPPPLAPWTVASLDLPAGVRNAALNPRFTPWGTNIVGPAILYTQRLINLDRATGVSVSALYARGSQSARDMALGLQTASDEQLTLFFTQVRDAQGPTKAVLVRVNTGLNDLNENMPSLGPAQVIDGSSAAAFRDNLLAIVQRLQSVWMLNGWNPSELFFNIAVAHPLSTPDNPRLIEYRDAAEALALTLPRTAVTRLDRLTSADEMALNGWYQSASFDRFHLTQPGFETLSARELDAIIDAGAAPAFSIPWSTVDAGGGVAVGGGFSLEGTAGQFDVGPVIGGGPFCVVSAYWEGGRLTSSCPGDLDFNSTINTLDLVAFLGVFGTTTPCGDGPDFNADGAVNTLDLVVLLAQFGVTCAS